jgi:tRNA 2-selenouridine synthase
LLYCWRGGQRSNAMATILSQIGWRVGLLQGGYKTWRRQVVAELHEGATDFKLLLIDGATGSAKSDIIRELIDRGAPAIDLEALAAHRGSVFGAIGAGQPSQKLFESLLWDRLGRLDRSRAVIVEAESAQIGGCVLPRRFWRSMRAARHVVIKADIGARADHILSAYRDMTADPARVLAAIGRLKSFHAKAKIEHWRELAEGRHYRDLAIDLMRDHYDPLYARGARGRAGAPLVEIPLVDFSPAGFARAAEAVWERA